MALSAGAPSAGVPVGSNPGGIATPDFNGDGKPDLVASISVLFNNTKR